MNDDGLNPTQRWYRKTSQEYRRGRYVKYRDYYLSRKRLHKGRLEEIKREQGCTRCGEKDPACLDFHHRDRGSKVLSVARLRTYSWKRILEEVEKCDVMCANCHRKLHYTSCDPGSTRPDLSEMCPS